MYELTKYGMFSSLSFINWLNNSCYAYAELLQGHATDYMLRELPECLKTVLRVQDDVKVLYSPAFSHKTLLKRVLSLAVFKNSLQESVRAAADRAAASISSICIREAGSTKKDRLVSQLSWSILWSLICLWNELPWNKDCRSSALLDVMLPVIVDGAVNASVTLNKKFWWVFLQTIIWLSQLLLHTIAVTQRAPFGFTRICLSRISGECVLCHKAVSRLKWLYVRIRP